MRESILTNTVRTSFLLLSLAAISGCGDLGNVNVKLTFPNDGGATEAATRRLVFIVREVPKAGSGCDLLWSTAPTSLAENRTVMDYPNRNDLVAAPVKLSEYPKLTLLVYAHPSKDTTTSPRIA